MIKHNCIVTVNNLSGDEDDKGRTSTTTGVRATIIPASQETLALYPDMPVGQSYSVIINDNSLSTLSRQATLVVTAVESSQFAVNDTFEIKGIARKDKVMGNTIFSAVAVKTND